MKKPSLPRGLHTLPGYLFPVLLTLGLLVGLYGLDSRSLSIPFEYRGDSLFSSALVKGILENGWSLHNPSLGQPTGLYLHDWFSADTLFVLMIKLFGLFSSSWTWVMNIFYLATFALSTLTSYFVLRVLKISYPISCAFSLLFAFLPYHFARGQSHLFLSGYFMIPLVTLLCLGIVSRKIRLFPERNGSTNAVPRDRTITFASILVVVLTAMTGIYYAFFTCLLLGVCGLIALVRDRTEGFRALLTALALILVITLTVLAQVVPNIAYQLEHGQNSVNPERHASQSESLGLKLDQLILPVTGHRVPSLASLKDRYNWNFPLVNENDSASLGIVGSAGLLLLLGSLLYYPLSDRRKQRDETLPVLSILTGAAILIGTIGGLGAIIAMLITPMIRAYNRISIFIGFFSLCALALLLEQAVSRVKHPGQRTAAAIGFSLMILALGVFDQTVDLQQTSRDQPQSATAEMHYRQDRDYFSALEASLPAGSSVFQLPYVHFPESPPLYDMASYDLLRPYLHTKKLTWSFGAMQGREADAWQLSLVDLPVADLLTQISAQGFTGILIDRSGYADRAQLFETELSVSIIDRPVVSPDQRYAFYKID